jgi:hypothetical protein
LYAKRTILVYNSFGNIKGLRNLGPQQIRANITDLTDEQLVSLRAQKSDDEFFYGAVNKTTSQIPGTDTDMIKISEKRTMPLGQLRQYGTNRKSEWRSFPSASQRVGGQVLYDLIEKLGVTNMGWVPINGNPYHKWYLDPDFGKKSVAALNQVVAELDKAEKSASALFEK